MRPWPPWRLGPAERREAGEPERLLRCEPASEPTAGPPVRRLEERLFVREGFIGTFLDTARIKEFSQQNNSAGNYKNEPNEM